MIADPRSPLVRLPEALSAAGYGLRPEVPEDDAFLIALYGSTRQRELDLVTFWTDEQKREFALSQFRAQRTHYRTYLIGASFDVIEREGTPIGRLYMIERQTTLYIIDIAIIPEMRGQGLGAAILEELTAQAASVGKSLSAMVERENPALRLYDRLGFTVIADHGAQFEVERIGNAPTPSA